MYRWYLPAAEGVTEGEKAAQQNQVLIAYNLGRLPSHTFGRELRARLDPLPVVALFPDKLSFGAHLL